MWQPLVQQVPSPGAPLVIGGGAELNPTIMSGITLKATSSLTNFDKPLRRFMDDSSGDSRLHQRAETQADNPLCRVGSAHSIGRFPS